MTRLGVRAALVDGHWRAGDVDIVDGRLMAIGLSPAIGQHVVASGFVEHQINGFSGIDFRTADEASYGRVAAALVETGVTRFRPTLFSSTIDGYCDSLGVIGEAMSADGRSAAGRNSDDRGAAVMGAHLEGPFLSSRWRGAHDERTFLEPDPVVVDRLLAAGPVGLVTLAPELPGALDVVGQLVSRGITVSIGHTDADASTCARAFAAGASMVTHCGNAHRRFTPRDPGLLGAALADGRVAVGVIGDGVHLADDTLRLIARAAGPRMVLVTDAIAPAGTGFHGTSPDGMVTIADGAARLADGTLAGSVATMDRCVRHMIDLGVPSALVLNAAGGNRLRVGHRTDIVVLDDQWNVVTAEVAAVGD